MQFPDPAEAATQRRENELEPEAGRAGGCGKALEFITSARPGGVSMGASADQEPVVTGSVGQGRAVHPLLDVTGRQEDVVKDRTINGRHQQKILVAVASVGVEHAN